MQMERTFQMGKTCRNAWERSEADCVEDTVRIQGVEVGCGCLWRALEFRF